MPPKEVTKVWFAMPAKTADGSCTNIRKRLLLSNLNELYSHFLSHYRVYALINFSRTIKKPFASQNFESRNLKLCVILDKKRT